MPIEAVLKTSPFVTHRSWNSALMGLSAVPSCSWVTPRLQAGNSQPVLTQAEQLTQSHLATQERPRDRDRQREEQEETKRDTQRGSERTREIGGEKKMREKQMEGEGERE